MVKRIDRANRELDVALRVNVIKNFQRDIADILHINVFIDER